MGLCSHMVMQRDALTGEVGTLGRGIEDVVEHGVAAIALHVCTYEIMSIRPTEVLPIKVLQETVRAKKRAQRSAARVWAGTLSNAGHALALRPDRAATTRGSHCAHTCT